MSLADSSMSLENFDPEFFDKATDRSYTSTPLSNRNSSSSQSSPGLYNLMNGRTGFDSKQFIDSLVKSLVLSPEQAADLHQIAKVSRPR